MVVNEDRFFLSHRKEIAVDARQQNCGMSIVERNRKGTLGKSERNRVCVQQPFIHNMSANPSQSRVTLSRDQSAAIKGLLIILVILGHNHFFGEVFSYNNHRWLYSFHVALFFVLPFFYPEHEFSWQHVWINAKRLLWPYTWMFGMLFLVDCFILKDASFDSGLFNTFITGDFYTLRHYTGFQYLWFLPAMFSMLCFKYLYTSANYIAKSVLLLGGFVFFTFAWVFLYWESFVHGVNEVMAQFSLLSFMLGWALFFLGSFTKWVVSHWCGSSLVPVAVLVLTFAGTAFADNTPFLAIADWISRTISPLASMLLLTRVGIGKSIILKKIGALSLPIYLFHQPVNVAVCTVMKSLNVASWVQFLLSFFMVFAITWLLVQIVFSITPLYSVLFAKKSGAKIS